MNRRDATGLLTALAGGTLVSTPIWLAGCKQDIEPEQFIFFTTDEMPLLEEIADTILPTTADSPGAKAAGISPFMDRYTGDCLEESAQNILRNGLGILDQRSREEYKQNFLKLSAAQRHELLLVVDKEAEEQQATAPPHYFTLLKGLTLLGYFTSEVGATQALRYLPVPGKYEGDIPYQEGDKAWAL